LESKMTETEAYDGLREWAARNGMSADSVGGTGWEAVDIDGLWILTPAGRSDTVYVVGPDLVRPVHPSREDLEEVIAEIEGS
jgi:hypothetical protein